MFGVFIYNTNNNTPPDVLYVQHITHRRKSLVLAFFFSSLTRVHYTRRSSFETFIFHTLRIYKYTIRVCCLLLKFIEFISSSLCYGDFCYRYTNSNNLFDFWGANHIFRIKSVETQYHILA